MGDAQAETWFGPGSAADWVQTSLRLKVMGWGGWCGGPCDFSVSPSPFGLDFGTLDLDFGLGLDN